MSTPGGLSGASGFAPLGTAPDPRISRRLGEVLVNSMLPDVQGMLSACVKDVGLAGFVAMMVTDQRALVHWTMCVQAACAAAQANPLNARYSGSALCEEALGMKERS